MIPGKVSIVIPARNEPYLQQTVSDVLTKATGDVEVIVVLDGYWPDPPLATHPRLIQLHNGQAKGMRPTVNAGATIARGEFLMKLDAHCMVAPGFDEVLKADCPEQSIVVPRRYALDVDAWAIETRTDTKYPIDYEYMICPASSDDPDPLRNVPWSARRDARAAIEIDETLIWQGSAWFMRRSHWARLGGLDVATFGLTAYREAHELGLKTWLAGGSVLVNKRTWYAHMHKGSRGRGYEVPDGERARVCRLTAEYFSRNLRTIIDRFGEVPTWQTQTRIAMMSANLGQFDRQTTWVPQVVAGATVSVHRFDDVTFPPRPHALTPALQSSLPKWFGPEFVHGADVYLWLDASFEIVSPFAVAWFLERLGDAELLVFRHPERTSVRAEIDYLSSRLERPGESYVTNRYGGEPLTEFAAHLDGDHSWIDDRLFSLGAFMYRPTLRVMELFRHVWFGQTRWHRLDQLHFPGALAKSRVVAKVLSEDIYHQGNGVVFTRSRSWRTRHQEQVGA